MPDTTVKYFNSTMSGAPTLSGEAGKLIDVLDACLVNGFGSVTLTSLIVADDVATATVSGGHNFAMVGATGPVITIAGATPSGLNGEWRITVTSSTVFTFATTGITDQTATGTITAKRSPAGFSIAFTDTNKRAYRANSLVGVRSYLRIYDTSTNWADLAFCESMTSLTSVTNGYAGYFQKSTTANSTTRPWFLFSDGRAIHFISENGSIYNSGLFFGDFVPISSNDAYCSGIIFNAGTAEANNVHYHQRLETTGHILCRSYQMTGLCVLFKASSITIGSDSYFGVTGTLYPNPIGNILPMAPISIWENQSPLVLRAKLPGVHNPLVGYSYLANNTIVDDAGKTYISKSFYTGNLIYEITGPWR